MTFVRQVGYEVVQRIRYPRPGSFFSQCFLGQPELLDYVVLRRKPHDADSQSQPPTLSDPP